MFRKKAAIAALIALSGAPASADIFVWANNVQGFWSDHTQWAGPNGKFPDSIFDSATVSGQFAEVIYTSDVALGELTVLNGGTVRSNGFSTFVSGDVMVWDHDSSLSITDSPDANDFDADTLTIRGATVTIHDAYAEIDEEVVLEQGGSLLGTGVIEMNSTTGDFVIDHGAVWASEEELLLTRSESSNARLDWTSPDATLIAWDGGDLRNELPYTGALGGEISLNGSAGTARFESVHPFVTTPNSEISFSTSNGYISLVEAPGIDVLGRIEVSGAGSFRGNLLGLRGEADLVEGANLGIYSVTTIFDSFQVGTSEPFAPVPEGDATVIQFSHLAENLQVTGFNIVDLGTGNTVFDLAGPEDFTMTIESGSLLDITAERVNTGLRQYTEGTINVEGVLSLAYASDPIIRWENRGEINMLDGSYIGRAIHNTGVIRGHGEFHNYVVNNGEIVAENGTLYFDRIREDGLVSGPAGIVRAEDGDIVMGNEAVLSSYSPFAGKIYVGNGEGSAELFETGDAFLVRESSGRRGAVHLNSGRFHTASVYFDSDLTVLGESEVRATSATHDYEIGFRDEQAEYTFSGTLSAQGNVLLREGPAFSGEGTLDCSSTARSVMLGDNVDLGDVTLAVAGDLQPGDLMSAVSQSTVGSLVLRPTTTTTMDIAGPTLDIDHDQITARDTAAIDGELVIRSVDNYNPVPGQTITIIHADSVTGTFENVYLTQLNQAFGAVVEYYPSRVDVTFLCNADVNMDGVLNGADFNAWLAAYNNNDPLADQNGDGILNGADFNAWLQNFQQGCI